MSDEAPKEEAPAAASKAGGGSKILPILMFVNLAVSGACLFFALKPKQVIVTAPPAEAAHGEKEPGAGPMATIEPFVVNLNEIGSSRYLKATFELELSDKHAQEAFEKGKRGVRDEVLRYLSGLAVADTMGMENKDKIRTEILARIDKELGGGKVKKVFFNDFVVQ